MAKRVMENKQAENEAVRERFKRFYDMCRPNVAALAEEIIHLETRSLYKWRVNKLDYGEKNLKKVRDYLDSIGF